MGTRVIARRYTLEVPERARPGCAVWRGRDGTTGAAVVVTLLDDHPEADTTLAALAAVRHPSLPVVLDHGLDDGVRWVVTPARAGVSARVRLGERPGAAAAADLGAALADALDALHARGLVQGPFDLDAVVLDEVGPPRLEDLATGGLDRPADQADDDVRCLAALLRTSLGVPAGIEPLEVEGMPPRLAGLLQSMASIAPPSAADARDALRRVARDAEVGAWDPFPPGPVAAPPPPAGEVRRRGRALPIAVGVLAVLVLALAVVVVARVVDRRDADRRAAATELPGPITTITGTVEGGGITATAAATTAAAETATTEPATTAAAPPGPDRTPRPLRIASITALDPAGDQTENPDQARRAIDGSPRTGWSTELYKQGVIERKYGVGLQLVLATPARLRRVVIRSAPVGATVRIYAVRGALPARTPRDWPAASAAVVLKRPRAVVPVDRVAPATALLVWIVGLPPLPGGYGVRIDDVRVIGIPTGA